jgi:hypothetical protein
MQRGGERVGVVDSGTPNVDEPQLNRFMAKQFSNG